jgi:hypothetical protein
LPGPQKWEKQPASQIVTAKKRALPAASKQTDRL